MEEIARRIASCHPSGGQIALFWMAGAGFVLKTAELTIGIDLYLSNACQTDAGFKRLYPTLVTANELNLDLLVTTHDHPDHLDPESVVPFALAGTTILGPVSCMGYCRQRGIPDDHLIELNRGESAQFRGVDIEAFVSDHGEYSPDCIGVVLAADGKTVYYASDTCPRFDVIDRVRARYEVDAYLVPINGRFGNPDSVQAAAMTARLAPRYVVPCHFWMFIEHGGEPWIFAEEAAKQCPDTEVRMLAVGETLLI
jgi:L-ascorbate 6-phosphate lactonase